MKQVVCKVEELGRGEMVAAQLGPMPVVAVRSHDGSLYGLLNKCLHQGGRLSEGKLLGYSCAERPGEYREERDREVVKCPWHGYEYDVRTGCTLFDSNRCLRTFTVREEDGQIVIET